MPDCAPESTRSYHKQMSVIVRIVSNRKQEVMIEESFLLFISVENTIGKILCEGVLQRLREYDTLLFENFRGQGRNSGANVKNTEKCELDFCKYIGQRCLTLWMPPFQFSTSRCCSCKWSKIFFRFFFN
jgi:hypothetical protein